MVSAGRGPFPTDRARIVNSFEANLSKVVSIGLRSLPMRQVTCNNFLIGAMRGFGNLHHDSGTYIV